LAPGKQRLESLLLYIDSRRADTKIDGVRSYFYSAKEKVCRFRSYGGRQKSARSKT